MSKSFVLQFKEDFSFLKKYGFVFAKDPLNPNRPCYKNRYGEIVMWYDPQGGIAKPLEVYVQVNGWKKSINLDEEYKKYFNRSTFFQSTPKAFQELFEYIVSTDSYFYGIYITKEVIQSDEDAVLKELLKNEKNNNINIRIASERNTKLLMIIGLVSFVTQFLLIMFKEYFLNLKYIFIINNILCITTFVVCITIILGMTLNSFSKLLIIIYPIILFILLYFFNNRFDYIVYFVYLLLTFAYLIVTLIVSLFRKDKKYWTNGLMAIIYPFCVGTYKSFMLNEYVFFVDINTQYFVIIGLVLAVIAVLFFIFIKKSKMKKREYFGLVLAIFSTVLLLLVALPQFTIQNYNYAFDQSNGIPVSYKITDKNTRHSSGRYGGTRHYLTILKDGKEESIEVSRIVYYEYKKGEKITLYQYEGALDSTYFYYDLEIIK